jgi:hypothetical protein
VKKWLCLAAVLLIFSGQLFAQATDDGFGSHIIWKHEIKGIVATGLHQATTDAAGDLWLVSDPFDAEPSLVHIDLNGTVVSNDKIPDSIHPTFPEIGSFALATSTDGSLGVLASYSHAVGRAISNDGADFVLLEKGKLGNPLKIAKSGPQYTSLVSLSDNHFLALGDQDPMVVIRLSAEGKIDWQRRFPSSWDLPSGASLGHGAACVLSSGYGVPWMHLMRMDDAGHVQSQTKFQGWDGVISSGPSDSCVALYSTGSPKQNRIRFHLALFDPSLKQNWSVAMPVDSSWGGSFYLASLKDGWVVVTDSDVKTGRVLIAKYDLSGAVIWSLPSVEISHPSRLVVGAGDTFYLIYRSSEDRDSSIILKAR